MRDIVHIQVGQCGNQISSKVFLTRILQRLSGETRANGCSIAGHAANPVLVVELERAQQFLSYTGQDKVTAKNKVQMLHSYDYGL